ncbi:hypothetical protein D3C87_2092930 [compost metagenome]
MATIESRPKNQILLTEISQRPVDHRRAYWSVPTKFSAAKAGKMREFVNESTNE